MSALDPRIVELIHADVDGELDDREELTRALQESAEAQAFHDDMHRLHAVLGEVETLDPPAGLRAGILSRVADRQPVRAGLGWNPLGWLTPPPLRFAMTFALGLLVGAGALGLMGQFPVDDRQITGTMGRPAAVPATAVRVDGAEIGIEGITGTVELRQAGTTLFVDFSVTTAAAAEAVIDVGDQALSVRGLQLDGAAPAVQLNAQRVAVQLSGQQRFWVRLEHPTDRDAVVRIRLQTSEDGPAERLELRAGPGIRG